jgi:hypothetical protein
VGDLCSELLVLHHEDLELLDVVDEHLPEAGGQRDRVKTVSDVGHLLNLSGFINDSENNIQ